MLGMLKINETGDYVVLSLYGKGWGLLIGMHVLATRIGSNNKATQHINIYLTMAAAIYTA